MVFIIFLLKIDLNFNEKQYQFQSKKLRRMLSNFPFDKFLNLLESKTTRKGVKLKKVNPAYTSFIGIWKYSNRDDISSKHNAKSKDYSAALVIGRRGLGFKERSVICVRGLDDDGLLNGKSVSNTFSIGVEQILYKLEKEYKKSNHCNKSNWSLWNKFKKLDLNYNDFGLTIKRLTVTNT